MPTEIEDVQKVKRFREIVSLIQASGESIENESMFSKSCTANRKYISILKCQSFQNIENKIKETKEENLFSLSGMYQGAYYNYTAKLYAMIKESISTQIGEKLCYSTTDLTYLISKYKLNLLFNENSIF